MDGGSCLRGRPRPRFGRWVASSESMGRGTAWLAERDHFDSSSEAGTFLTLERWLATDSLCILGLTYRLLTRDS